MKKKTKVERAGVVERDGKHYCEKCGADLEGNANLVCHMDGAEFYINQYECAECKACILVKVTRTKEERW